MQIALNNHKSQTAKVHLTLSFLRLASLAVALLFMTVASQAQNPGAIMGSGNFNAGDGEYGTAAEQYDALNFLGAKMSRLNIYPDRYWSGSAPTPTVVQNAVLEARSKNNTPMILFEYYSEWGPLGDYNKWFAIGRDFATQFRPNSPWLVSQGITGWGISVYSAINEPDLAVDIPTSTYVNALRGLADGAHSVDATLKVIPGGFMSENAYSNHTLQGYGTAIAQLLNDGTLDGIDLHTYNDISFAPIVDSNGNATFDWSPQADFDSVKSGSGITRDINFYTTEFNFKNGTQGINETLAAKRFLTCIWANLGVVKNDGQTAATQFAFPWNAFHTLSQDVTYGLSTQLTPYTPSVRGTTLKLVLDQTAGMSFVSRDPKGRGEFILNGNNKKMWVWQNYPNWSNVAGTSYTVSGIPTGTTSLQVYGYNGLRSTIPISGQTSYNVTGLLTKETYMFLANAADGGPGQPDLIVTDISWSPASPQTGNAVTFSATIQNVGTAATPAGVIHGVEFQVDGVQVNWSDNSTASLAVNATRIVTANSGPNGGSSTWTATSGTHSILATVDDVDRIVESNDNNNTRTESMSVTSSQPDLVVTDISWSPASPATGQAVTFSATIQNVGTAATPAGVVHRVGFFVDGNLVNWSNTSTTSLAPNATRILTANTGPTGSSTWTATNGTHTILASVDDTSLIAESNEGNNTRTESMTVAGTGQPDLIVAAISWTPATPIKNQLVTFSATIKNQGTAATPAGVIHGVGFSVDGTQVSWADLYVSSLAPGASVTVTANGGPAGSSTWKATLGTHTILAFVDDVNRIAESNENNNTLTRSMTVKNH